MISAAAERVESRLDRRPPRGGRRAQPVRRLECSGDMPWGIHAPLEDQRCPRCGWERR